MAVDRCVVCGSSFEEGDKVVRIERGKLSGGTVTSPKEWGKAHSAPCFERAFSSPQLVLERIKKLSKSDKTPASKVLPVTK